MPLRIHRPSRSVNAFTLVELLVVVTIILLLVALLIPSLVRAKKRAALVLCASNERSMMIACHMYAMDYEDHLPYDDPWWAPNGCAFWWQRLGGWQVNNETLPVYLQPFVYQFSKTIWCCPFVTTELAPSVNPVYFWGRWNVHYGMNTNVLTVFYDYSGWNANRDVLLTKLNNSTVVIADGGIENDNPLPGLWYFSPNFNSGMGPPLGTWNQFAPWPVDRTAQTVTQLHGGSYNAAFADGHVEPETTVTPQLLAIPPQ